MCIYLYVCVFVCELTSLTNRSFCTIVLRMNANRCISTARSMRTSSSSSEASKLLSGCMWASAASLSMYLLCTNWTTMHHSHICIAISVVELYLSRSNSRWACSRKSETRTEAVPWLRSWATRCGRSWLARRKSLARTLQSSAPLLSPHSLCCWKWEVTKI